MESKRLFAELYMHLKAETSLTGFCQEGGDTLDRFLYMNPVHVRKVLEDTSGCNEKYGAFARILADQRPAYEAAMDDADELWLFMDSYGGNAHVWNNLVTTIRCMQSQRKKIFACVNRAGSTAACTVASCHTADLHCLPDSPFMWHHGDFESLSDRSSLEADLKLVHAEARNRLVELFNYCNVRCRSQECRIQFYNALLPLYQDAGSENADIADINEALRLVAVSPREGEACYVDGASYAYENRYDLKGRAVFTGQQLHDFFSQTYLSGDFREMAEKFEEQTGNKVQWGSLTTPWDRFFTLAVLQREGIEKGGNLSYTFNESGILHFSFIRGDESGNTFPAPAGDEKDVWFERLWKSNFSTKNPFENRDCQCL